MLIITGLGRCGTSLIAKFLTLQGYNLGNCKWDDNIRAGMEDSQVVQINRVLAEQYKKGDSYHARTIIKVWLRTKALSIVKDPRFTWPGVLLPWAEVVKDLNILFMHRKFEEIALSRARLGEHSNDVSDTRIYNLTRLYEDFSQFFNVVFLHNLKFRVLCFPEVLDNFPSVWQALHDLGVKIDLDCGAEIWKTTIKPELITSSKGFSSAKKVT
jgi:hypothetical protein